MPKDAIIELTKRMHQLERQIRKTQVTGFQRPTWLAAALESASWNGTAYSTTAKTLIDLSAVFGAPANVKAVLMTVATKDSGSAASDCFMYLSPVADALVGMFTGCAGLANDQWNRDTMIVPCDANGDIYYQIAASGAGTFDVFMQIWGYFL